jgi:hypothetical protein
MRPTRGKESIGEDTMSAVGIEARLDAAPAGGGADEISQRLESLPGSV